MADSYNITWDASGKRAFENGVDRGVLYPATVGTDGAITYGDAVAWDGLTGFTESPDGAEPNDLYADNIKYATLRSTETYGATIEAYTYPDEFAACDGSASPVTGVYLGQQTRKPFGFCCRTNVGNDSEYSESDNNYKLHIVYNCTASPSERSYETVNDSPDAITFSWEITSTPVTVGTINGTEYKPVSSITIDTTKLSSAQKTKLSTLLETLYGTGTTKGKLPTPAEVVTALTAA